MVGANTVGATMRPKECHVPKNVWFDTFEMAQRNVERKPPGWFVWRCYDHYHVKPKKWVKHDI